MVGPGGLEPPTSRLSGVRSNQLSYGPMLAESAKPEIHIIFKDRKRSLKTE